MIKEAVKKIADKLESKNKKEFLKRKEEGEKYVESTKEDLKKLFKKTMCALTNLT